MYQEFSTSGRANESVLLSILQTGSILPRMQIKLSLYNHIKIPIGSIASEIR